MVHWVSVRMARPPTHVPKRPTHPRNPAPPQTTSWPSTRRRPGRRAARTAARPPPSASSSAPSAPSAWWVAACGGHSTPRQRGAQLCTPYLTSLLGDAAGGCCAAAAHAQAVHTRCLLRLLRCAVLCLLRRTPCAPRRAESHGSPRCACTAALALYFSCIYCSVTLHRGVGRCLNEGSCELASQVCLDLRTGKSTVTRLPGVLPGDFPVIPPSATGVCGCRAGQGAARPALRGSAAHGEQLSRLASEASGAAGHHP